MIMIMIMIMILIMIMIMDWYRENIEAGVRNLRVRTTLFHKPRRN